MDQIHGDAGHPPAYSGGPAAGDPVDDGAQRAEQQAKAAGQNGPAHGGLHTPEQPRQTEQQRPGVEIAEAPEAEAPDAKFQRYVQRHGVQPPPAEANRQQHHQQGHRFDVGQSGHGHFGGEDRGSQQAEQRQVPDGNMFHISQWCRPRCRRHHPPARCCQRRSGPPRRRTAAATSRCPRRSPPSRRPPCPRRCRTHPRCRRSG